MNGKFYTVGIILTGIVLAVIYFMSESVMLEQPQSNPVIDTGIRINPP